MYRGKCFILFDSFFEILHYVSGPVRGIGVLHFRIIMHFLVRALEVQERSRIGSRRAGTVLETACRVDGAGNTRCQVFCVKIGQEVIHLFIRHGAFVCLCNVSGPGYDLEIIWEIPKESHVGSNCRERIVAQCCCGIAEGAALAVRNP